MSADILEAWSSAMRSGDFETAWHLSDGVLATRGGQPCHHLPRHEQPIWNGTPLDGKRVLVRCYHGLGDTIQFSRYFALLEKSVRQLIVWAEPTLLDILSTVDGIGTLLPLHDGVPEVDYDVDVEIMELPHVFRTTIETIPATVPYIHVPRTHAMPANNVKVGLVWQAGDWDTTRSIDFESLAPLFTLSNIDIYALQPDVPAEARERGVIVDERRMSIRGLAELICAMDVVISVDTMAAHLAGALGVTTWTLLPRQADWRWMDARTDSPWYPTMRLFRQDERCRWEPVIESVAARFRRC